ncbi:DUF7402 domain-containing protein [Fodinicola acaciae]|uniref:DUF7402 domain-containing protein n=1 Tax=Fodinicola acaciae TaxID=2681555 RepID=UPI0013D692A3|nr:hypothetical protein [Fodinicola acaciae]
MHGRLSRVFLAAALAAAALVGLSPAPAVADGPVSTVTADFSVNDGTGSPYVFGGTINHLDEPAQLDALRQSGVKLLRRDAYLSEIVPNTTIADWNANVGNVRDPSTWDWSKYGWVDLYHNRGFKILLIMSYNTTWLCTSHPGRADCAHQPPSDFGIYEDIIGKIYQHFTGKVDLVEIWNEPNLSGFLNVPEADAIPVYEDIYRHAAHAIRGVDAGIPIGGPVISEPDATNKVWANALLQDTRIPREDINFLSYHHYTPVANDTVALWQSIARDNGRPDLPVYVTEWNYTAAFNVNPIVGDHPDMVSYDANRLTALYRQHAAGATFYADNVQSSIDTSFFTTYANGTLTPKARTFRMMSTDLGLGAGNGTLGGISYGNPVTNAGAATNAAGDRVAWVVNDGTDPLQVDLRLLGMGNGSGPVWANVFEASANQAVTSPRSTMSLAVSDGAATLPLGVPAKSVVGVRLTPYAIADQTNLAATATVTASSQTAGLEASRVTDGITGRWGVGEWASAGERTPFVRLSWPAEQSIGRVVLYDRSNPTDQVLGGTLTFGDGSTVHVPELPNDGTGKSITFAPRTTDSVTFKVDSVSGGTLNAGLSEFQVFHGENVAPDATVTSSSELDTEAHAHGDAVDGIVGQPNGQWVSTESTPWIRLSWLNPRPVDEVVLTDQVGSAGHANSGTLTFSDGSSVPVTGIPTDGTPRSVPFASKFVSWVQFHASGGTGPNVGLSEMQVFQEENLASSADVTASSVYRDPTTGLTLPASMATDGTINQWYVGEWASNGDPRPTLSLDLGAARSVGRVVLYDRNNLIDQVTAGTLRFGDGSTVAVPSLDNSGLGTSVTFPARSTTSITFTVTGARDGTLNNGLSEIQIFAA